MNPMDTDLRNRFTFHPATPSTGPKHEDVRMASLHFATFISSTVPPGREQALALTKIEEAMMWANAGIARNSPTE